MKLFLSTALLCFVAAAASAVTTQQEDVIAVIDDDEEVQQGHRMLPNYYPKLPKPPQCDASPYCKGHNCCPCDPSPYCYDTWGGNNCCPRRPGTPLLRNLRRNSRWWGQEGWLRRQERWWLLLRWWLLQWRRGYNGFGGKGGKMGGYYGFGFNEVVCETICEGGSGYGYGCNNGGYNYGYGGGGTFLPGVPTPGPSYPAWGPNENCYEVCAEACVFSSGGKNRHCVLLHFTTDPSLFFLF